MRDAATDRIACHLGQKPCVFFSCFCCGDLHRRKTRPDLLDSSCLASPGEHRARSTPSQPATSVTFATSARFSKIVKPNYRPRNGWSRRGRYVYSWRLLERIEFESLRLWRPGFADEFVWGEAPEVLRRLVNTEGCAFGLNMGISESGRG